MRLTFSRATMRILSTSIALSVAIPLSAEQGRGQRPDSPPGFIFSDPGPPPPTLKEMFDAADVVVVASIAISGTPSVDAKRPIVSRKHDLNLEEVFKGKAITEFHSIRLEQTGGIAYSGDRKVESEGPSTLLGKGTNAIFFLKKSARGDYYILPWGDASVILIDKETGRASVPASLKKFPELANARTGDDVRVRLRTFIVR